MLVLAEMATCCLKPAVTSEIAQSLLDSKNIIVRVVLAHLCDMSVYEG